MQQNFQQAPHPRVFDPNPGRARCAIPHRQRNTPQKRELLMHIQILRLMRGKTVEDCQKLRTRLAQVSQPFLQFEILQIVRRDLVAQISRAFLILFHPRVFPVSPKHMPAMLHLFHDRLQLALDPVPVSLPEESPDALPMHTP